MARPPSRRRAAWVAALLVSSAFLWPAPAPAYSEPVDPHVVDLGTLPGGVGSSAASISDTGFVTGSSYRRSLADEPPPPRAFLWHRFLGMVDLGTLGGPTAEGRAVNDWGEVTGCADGAEDTGSHPFLWSPLTRRMRNLDARTHTGFGCGTDLNDAHQVTGFSQAPDGGTHAFFWSRRTGQLDIGTLGGPFSTPAGINARGMVAGSSDADGQTHAFVWTRRDGIRDLGTLGGDDSAAVDLNDAGVVTGTSDTADGTPHAFVWSAATGMRDLGTLGSGSHASAISAKGWVVGWNTYPDPVAGSRDSAFVWRPRVGMTDVGGSGGDTVLTAVNARGRAVGRASSNTPPFEKRVILWSPRAGVRDLDTLEPEAIAFPVDINRWGRSVGTVETADGGRRATLWRP